MSVITKDCKLFVNYKARLNADAVKTATGDIKVEGNSGSPGAVRVKTYDRN